MHIKTINEEKMTMLAKVLNNDVLPNLFGQRVGFCLCVFDDTKSEYVSNTNRKTAIKLLRQTAIKLETKKK